MNPEKEVGFLPLNSIYGNMFRNRSREQPQQQRGIKNNNITNSKENFDDNISKKGTNGMGSNNIYVTRDIITGNPKSFTTVNTKDINSIFKSTESTIKNIKSSSMNNINTVNMKSGTKVNSANSDIKGNMISQNIKGSSCHSVDKNLSDIDKESKGYTSNLRTFSVRSWLDDSSLSCNGSITASTASINGTNNQDPEKNNIDESYYHHLPSSPGSRSSLGSITPNQELSSRSNIESFSYYRSNNSLNSRPSKKNHSLYLNSYLEPVISGEKKSTPLYSPPPSIVDLSSKTKPQYNKISRQRKSIYSRLNDNYLSDLLKAGSH